MSLPRFHYGLESGTNAALANRNALPGDGNLHHVAKCSQGSRGGFEVDVLGAKAPRGFEGGDHIREAEVSKLHYTSLMSCICIGPRVMPCASNFQMYVCCGMGHSHMPAK